MTRKVFGVERERFDLAVRYGISVSKLGAGRPANIPTEMSSYVLTRMCITAETISHLTERGITDKSVTLDHYSISVVARNIIEAAVMFHYLTEEGVADEEWNLRGKILDLHESIIKLRLFKGLGAQDEADRFRKIVSELRDQIKSQPAYQYLDKDRQDKVVGGQELYLKGFRASAKLLEVDPVLFDGVYNYLSAQVHVSSHSYYDTPAKLDFSSPADHQLYATSFALSMARYALLHSVLRYIFADKRLVEEVRPEEIENMQRLMKLEYGELDRIEM